MENFDRKKHWEHIYQTKELDSVSWYQKTPKTSLGFLQELGLEKTAKIIDVGGGDSFLVDHLLDLGFENLTVLDISEGAIKRAKKRLGKLADKVKWIVADAATFIPDEQYDFWHDRAAFHFLTETSEIQHYVKMLSKGITKNGFLVLGTFSEQGPKKCSGIPIRQYSGSSMTKLLKPAFAKIRCITVDHETPFDTIQNFTFCSFRKL